MMTEIKYVLFLECACLSEDKFLYSLFDQMGYGNLPIGCYIKNDILRLRGSKEAFVILDSENIHDTHKKLCSFIRNDLNLIAPIERLERLNDTKVATPMWESWHNVRSKNDKDLLIDMFVLDRKKQFKLSIADTRILRSRIQTGILLKNIGIIEMKNNRIDDISGILFKKGLVNYSENESVIADQNSETPTPKKMSDLWKKHILKLV